jgi:hypothetical protein
MAPAPGIRLTTRLDDALRSALAPLAAAAALVAAPAQAWDAPVHRAITEVALAKAAEASGAAWLAEPATVARAAFTATEADRYRGTKIAFLDHENGPEHYLDIELLGAHDLSLATLPPLRYDFVNAVARTSAASRHRRTHRRASPTLASFPTRSPNTMRSSSRR